jgi:hypothetical protein
MDDGGEMYDLFSVYCWWVDPGVGWSWTLDGGERGGK